MTPHNPLRVAIGATSLITPLTGIGQYTNNLAKILTENEDLSLIFNYGFGWSDVATPKTIKNLKSIKTLFKRLIPRPYEVSRMLQQHHFNAGIKKFRPDIYHEPNFLPFHFDGPTVITVHDLSFLRYPETHPDSRVKIMNKLLPKAIENAAHILADSEFSRQEIISEFGVAENRITTTLLGVTKDFKPRSQEICQSAMDFHQLRFGEYILAVGTLEPRKNLLQVIRAYLQLPVAFAKHFPLIIVGMKGWKTEGTQSELNQLLSDGRARLLGYVRAAELTAIYSGARAFVYPSIYEGFGLPVLEAMASGTPVIVSNRSSLPEVAGEAGISVDPNNIDGMREALQMLGEDNLEHQKRSLASIDQAGKFSWENCAAKTIEVYRHVAARR